jgi:ABC-type sugar transport system substrate-binding protein
MEVFMSNGFRVSAGAAAAAFGAVLGCLASSGCGSGDFVPPPPPELQSGAAAPRAANASVPDAPGSYDPAPGIKTVELVLSGRVDPEEAEVEKSAARVQAGLEKARLRATPPPASSAKSGSTTTNQAKEFREALARHPHAIIVEPADPTDRDLAQAIAEARAAKVPVVVLGRAISVEPQAQAARPAAPLIKLEAPSFTETGRKIVASAIRNAKNAKLDPTGGALILVNTAADFLVAERVAALRDALQAAGITAIDEVTFASDLDAGAKLVIERLKADAKAVFVFFVDVQGGTAANLASGEVAGERPFIQAGFTSDENLSRMVSVGEFAAVAEYIPARAVRKAVSLAVAAANGRAVPERVEAPMEFKDSPPKSGAPAMQARYKAMKNAAKKG